jgi:predicted kinase
VPTAHLICGPTAAGKTTYALALSGRGSSVRLSIDEWVQALFAADRETPPNPEWLVDRTSRCEEQIWAVAEQILGAGVNVILDLGLPRAEHRDIWRARVAGTIAESKLHYLDVSVAIRRARVAERIRSRTPGNGFQLTEEIFEWMEARFEPPTDDELYGAMIVCAE